MAADTLVTGSKLTAIANAIRTKGGTSSPLTLDQMPQAVADLPSGGVTLGAGAAKANVTRVFADGAIGSNADLVVTAADLLAAADRQGNVNLDTLAFYGSEWLRKITIPSGTYVSVGALCACPNLEEIEVLGELIFYYRSKGRPSPYFNLPASPFIENPKLRSIDLSGFRPYGSSGNQQLPQYFCTDCPMLTSISLPTDSRYTKLGTYGFYGTAITDLVVPSNFTYIPTTAFANGTKEGGATVSNSLETITFKGNVTEVVASNYAEPFQTSAPATSPLRKIIFEGNTAVPTLNGAYLFFQYGTTRAAGNLPQNFDGIYVPDALLSSWKAATNWASYASIIKPLSDLA